MPERPDWIATVTAAARAGGAKAPAEVWNEIETILRGKFSQAQLTVGEREQFARRLIESMTRANQESEK